MVMVDAALRPGRLDECIGLGSVRQVLKVSTQAAQERQEALCHTLFYGPPGTGKTTLCAALAAEMGGRLVTTSGPTLSRPFDAFMTVANLKAGDVLCIDEIHQLPKKCEEVLYPVLEDRQLHLVVGEGVNRRTVVQTLPPITLVAATTRYGMLTAPLRERFGLTLRLDYYPVDDLARIVGRSASLLGLAVHEGVSRAIAVRSRGTPRIANQLLARVRDWAQVVGRSGGVIEVGAVEQCMASLGIDALGLGETDRRVLEAIADKFLGGPVGLETLAAAVNEDEGTVTDVVEPFLMSLGFLERTGRGRQLTASGREYVGR